MSRKELPNPRWTLSTAIRNGVLLWAIFSFMSLVYNAMFATYTTGTPKHPLVKDILFGSGFLPCCLYLSWAWRPRRKYARWHRWLASLTAHIYLLSLFLLGGIAAWNTLLNHPWKEVVNGILIVLFTLAWILPALSYPVAKKLSDVQLELNLRILSCGGIGSLMVLAGILGAAFGMGASRNGETGSVILAAGFLISLLALFGAQYSAEYLWRYRPWAKEEDE